MNKNQIEEAIIVLMEKEGYFWCEKCEMWVIEEDRDFYHKNHDL